MAASELLRNQWRQTCLYYDGKQALCIRLLKYKLYRGAWCSE